MAEGWANCGLGVGKKFRESWVVVTRMSWFCDAQGPGGVEKGLEMALTITRADIIELVNELARRNGVTPEEVVHAAVLKDARAVQLTPEQQALVDRMMEINARCAAILTSDQRT